MSDRVEWVTDPRRFAAVEACWDRLASGPFDRHAWYSAWWGAFANGRRLAVCLLWRDESLVAALPLCRSRGRLEAMANFHSPQFEPLAQSRDALESVMKAALDASGGELRLTPVPSAGDAFGVCLEACEQAGRLVVVGAQHTSPVTDTSGEFSTWRSARKDALRELERRRRKLARDHDPVIRLIDRPENLERELTRGLEVEGSGWKGRQGTAIVSSPETLAFYGSLARAFHGTGELVLSSIALEDRVVAFDLALLQGGRYWLLKTGFDERARSLAPGLVLRHHVIERCFELGLAAHEFLGDSMPWKLPFATGERAHAQILAFRRRPDSLLRYSLRRLPRGRMAQAYRRLRASRPAR
ncbi:MAG: GNAT family N-acetyltransferase [Thermoleophilaceae bacterium]